MEQTEGKCGFCRKYEEIRFWGDNKWYNYCHRGDSLLPCDGNGTYTDEYGKQHRCRARIQIHDDNE